MIDEDQLIEATLKFANLNIQKPEQVEWLFMPFARPDQDWQSLIDEGKKGAQTYLENDQRKVRRWLERIMHNRRLPKDDVEELKIVVERTVITNPHLTFSPHGGPTFEYELIFNGVEACWSYGIALLLNREKAKLLRRCPLRECQKYFLDQYRRSHPQMYCPKTNHQHTDKQRRYRLEKQAQRWANRIKHKTADIIDIENKSPEVRTRVNEILKRKLK